MRGDVQLAGADLCAQLTSLCALSSESLVRQKTCQLIATVCCLHAARGTDDKLAVSSTHSLSYFTVLVLYTPTVSNLCL